MTAIKGSPLTPNKLPKNPSGPDAESFTITSGFVIDHNAVYYEYDI